MKLSEAKRNRVLSQVYEHERQGSAHLSDRVLDSVPTDVLRISLAEGLSHEGAVKLAEVFGSDSVAECYIGEDWGKEKGSPDDSKEPDDSEPA